MENLLLIFSVVLGSFLNGGASTLQIPIDAEAGKKFFRFKMTE